ncbi:MAG: caspase family protein, partial [Bacteroidota bacterium]
MPKGVSLHIGVNQVDQSHYLGLTDLKAAVHDAEDYLHIAQNIFNYQNSTIFTNESATTENVKNKLQEYANHLEAGDILFLTYSGHGSQIEDPNFKIKGDEPYDQTWCLFDRQLLDDEIFEAFKKFKDGVSILVISDSCHSGTVTKNIPGNSQSPEAIL